MAIEIELKAHAANYRQVRSKLDALAAGPGASGGGEAFVKDDACWFSAAAPSAAASGIRLRLEEKAGVKTSLVTWKTKEKREGIEVNLEKECTVSDAAVFEELLASLGFEIKIRKHKEGWGWKLPGPVSAELCEVSGFRAGGKKALLGWFLELEIIAGEDSPKTVEAARSKLLCLLEKAGLEESSVESRYYTELISAFSPS